MIHLFVEQLAEAPDHNGGTDDRKQAGMKAKKQRISVEGRIRILSLLAGCEGLRVLFFSVFVGCALAAGSASKVGQHRQEKMKRGFGWFLFVIALMMASRHSSDIAFL